MSVPGLVINILIEVDESLIDLSIDEGLFVSLNSVHDIPIDRVWMEIQRNFRFEVDHWWRKVVKGRCGEPVVSELAAAT